METVQAIPRRTASKADGVTRWMFEKISSYIQGQTLELGSGKSGIADLCIQNGLRLFLSDANGEYRERLRKRFAGQAEMLGILPIDPADDAFDTYYAHLFGAFDTVIGLNIAKPLAHNHAAVVNCIKLLAQGGHLLLLAPASVALYDGMEEGLTDWQRYNRQSIKKLLPVGVEIVKTRYFNLAGIFAWLPLLYVSTYHQKIPLFRFKDILMSRQAGLCAVVVLKKIDL